MKYHIHMALQNYISKIVRHGSQNVFEHVEQ
jgi:hypothetical protein